MKKICGEIRDLQLQRRYELETPKETLFDSFAPRADKLLLVRRLKLTRALVKDFSNALEWEDEEERLFKIMYSTIMDAILEETAAVAVHTCPAPPPYQGRKEAEMDPQGDMQKARVLKSSH